jgi:hypothetical protein
MVTARRAPFGESALAANRDAGENIAMIRHRGSGRSWRAVLGLALALAGCASLKNTPEQDLAYARWQACEPPSGLIDIDRVEPSGRIWFTYYNESDKLKAVDCLAKGSGASLPTPVAVLRGRGGA